LRKALSEAVTFSSFQTYLYGDLTGDGQQTRLECRLGMQPLVYAFMILWFGITFLISLILLIDGSPTTVYAFGEKYIVSGRWATVFPMLFAAFGAALVKFGRYLARDEETFLIDFIRKTLDVRETK
jgi:hypothetical protein